MLKGKLQSSNGFTLIEGLFVLLIVSILFHLGTRVTNLNHLSVFMEQLMSQCVVVQEKAYSDKLRLFVEINEHYANFDNRKWVFPKEIVCDKNSFYYGPKGNISKASTIVCRNNKDSKALIFQLGSGRVRVE